jgi:hypothetical protein
MRAKCKVIFPAAGRLIFRAGRGKLALIVKRLLLFLAVVFLGCALRAEEKKRFVLYAVLTENSNVQLADGSKWMMDKGDTFPVVMFKEQQTKIVLQLAGTSFMIEAAHAKVVEEKDLTTQQLASYRTNVQQYIDSRSEKWKTEQAK